MNKLPLPFFIAALIFTTAVKGQANGQFPGPISTFDFGILFGPEYLEDLHFLKVAEPIHKTYLEEFRKLETRPVQGIDAVRQSMINKRYYTPSTVAAFEFVFKQIVALDNKLFSDLQATLPHLDSEIFKVARARRSLIRYQDSDSEIVGISLYGQLTSIVHSLNLPNDLSQESREIIHQALKSYELQTQKVLDDLIQASIADYKEAAITWEKEHLFPNLRSNDLFIQRLAMEKASSLYREIIQNGRREAILSNSVDKLIKSEMNALTIIQNALPTVKRQELLYLVIMKGRHPGYPVIQLAGIAQLTEEIFTKGRKHPEIRNNKMYQELYEEWARDSSEILMAMTASPWGFGRRDSERTIKVNNQTLTFPEAITKLDEYSRRAYEGRVKLREEVFAHRPDLQEALRSTTGSAIQFNPFAELEEDQWRPPSTGIPWDLNLISFDQLLKKLDNCQLTNSQIELLQGLHADAKQQWDARILHQLNVMKEREEIFQKNRGIERTDENSVPLFRDYLSIFETLQTIETELQNKALLAFGAGHKNCLQAAFFEIASDHFIPRNPDSFRYYAEFSQFPVSFSKVLNSISMTAKQRETLLIDLANSPKVMSGLQTLARWNFDFARKAEISQTKLFIAESELRENLNAGADSETLKTERTAISNAKKELVELIGNEHDDRTAAFRDLWAALKESLEKMPSRIHDEVTIAWIEGTFPELRRDPLRTELLLSEAANIEGLDAVTRIQIVDLHEHYRNDYAEMLRELADAHANPLDPEIEVTMQIILRNNLFFRHLFDRNERSVRTILELTNFFENQDPENEVITNFIQNRLMRYWKGDLYRLKAMSNY